MAIPGLYVVAKHVSRTMQVRIALLLLGGFIGLSHGEPAWVRSGGMRPQGSASRPVDRPVIMGVQQGFLLPRDRLVRINIGAVLHLLCREVDRKKLAFPVRLPQDNGGNEHAP